MLCPNFDLVQRYNISQMSLINIQVEKTNKALLVRHLEQLHKKKPDVAVRMVNDRYGHLESDDFM